MNSDKPTAIWLKVLAVVWMVWVFLDYWFKHPLYAASFGNTFIAIAIIHGMILTIAGVIWVKLARGQVSWFSLIVLFFALLWGGTLVNLVMYSKVEYTGLSVLFYMLRTLCFIGLLTGLTVSAYNVGSYLVESILIPSEKLASSVYIALGLCVFMILIFIVLLLNIFTWYVILLTIAWPLLVFYRRTWRSLKALSQPIPFSNKVCGVGIVCLLFIVLINALTFGHTLSPYPVGFDAQNYYINLPKLITEAAALQTGYQPYNWSLLQAAGYGLTGRVEMLLILSWYGLVLVQWATYEIGCRVMKLRPEIALMAVTLFSYMPSVTTQASQELKVDLGLTFMLLAMVISGFSLIQNLLSKPTRQSMVALAVIVGVLGGIALGIKLTAIIAILAVIAILWYHGLGRMAFVGVFFICLALVFFVQLDTRAGLRVYHDSVAWLQIVSLFVGIGCLFFAVKEHVRKGLKLIYLSAVIVMSSSLVFTPWMLKNYSEIQNPSFIQLLNGTAHGPVFNMKSIDRNLKKKDR